MKIDQGVLPTAMTVLKLLQYHTESNIRQGNFSRNIRGSKKTNEA